MNLNRFFTLLLLLSTSAVKLSAQNLPAKTTWEGTLANLGIILTISEDSLTKQKTAEFAVPQQNATGIKVSKLIITPDSLTADAAVMSSAYTAAFNSNKTTLTGLWKQRGGTYPLTLKRVANKAGYNRPQMPKAPFPYREEKVIYYNKDRSIQYGATLTIPKSVQNVPAVILITGSGQEDRDETIFGHKLFWVIADHLTRNGIAVLRVDDRGVGETTGDVMGATSADFAKDVMVGIDYLKGHPGIDIKNIGLIGHSEGGVIAPLIAVQTDDVAFIVSLAGVGIKGEDLMKIQNRTAYLKNGFTEDDVARTESFMLMARTLADRYTNRDSLKAAYEQSKADWLKQQPDAFLAKAGLKGKSSEALLNQLSATMFMPWMRYFLNYDPATTLTKIKIPVLALNGGKDVQVSAKENLAGFNALLTQAGNKDFNTVLLPNLNHMFQNAGTGDVSEYSTIDETISPEVLDIITKWINGLKPRK
ncbi:alpha/beta hydrolase family protein [Mucilaginibacter sp. UYCu711]|uniref:alpha/beta hydrolase family protein n=1 Tax=Mucilaginibacter sp. UYCu711 TaxID=3156339 RepID=UPI003D25659A